VTLGEVLRGEPQTIHVWYVTKGISRVGPGPKTKDQRPKTKDPSVTSIDSAILPLYAVRLSERTAWRSRDRR